MSSIDINVYLNTLRQKGYLSYEYNPFHNYQTNEDLYEVEGFLIPKGLAVNKKNGDLLTQTNDGKWIDKRGKIVKEENILTIPKNIDPTYRAGSLIDLDTSNLNFDLEHPVDITVLPSYDGSVNLILNDGKNIPRLINSRFSARLKNTYEIVDRIGENDTNIYNSKTFDKDTSLYFLYKYNPTILYIGYVNGNLSVGSYCFYFTYCDSDENESDYIAESGLIPIFIGEDKNPWSMEGGIKNQNSNKGIKLKLENLDKSYNYIKVYYVRYFADYLQNRVYECKRIYLKYPINSNSVYLQITGNELAEDLDANLLNITRFNPNSILTLAQCKNMLFFGNIVKNSDNYRELLDCALRIIPSILELNISNVDNNYYSKTGEYGYYDSKNMYNNVGYFDLEYYRFGVVFIYLNGTLSNVYNTLGLELLNNKELNNKEVINRKNSFFQPLNDNDIIQVRKYLEIDDYGWIKNKSEFYKNVDNISLNARGVCKFNYEIKDDKTILGIKFNIPLEVINYLKENLGIRGLFFVRQKRVPNVLALCYLLPMDSVLEAPVILYLEGDKDEYVTECFLSLGDNRLVLNYYEDRLYHYKNTNPDDYESSFTTHAYAAICPDFLLNLPYYNQIFNGNEFKLLKVSNSNSKFTKSNRFYTNENTTYSANQSQSTVTINSVTEDVPSVAIKDNVYKLEMGQAEEVFRFKYAEVDNGLYDVGGKKDSKKPEDVNKATNLVRGVYSPYLAIYSSSKLDTGHLYNIYQNSSIDSTLDYQNRMDSYEPFYAISDRFNFELLSKIEKSYKEKIDEKESEIKLDIRTISCWRGDCYINTFTYRVVRNFNDPTLANNDTIVDGETWKNNYDVSDSTKWNNIIRSDINAVLMGSWITFKVRSYMNYALRSVDHSYVSEEALMGQPRSFYPKNLNLWRGSNKIPDSYLYNDAFRASLGFKCYFTLLDINYIKNSFSNRIQYSAIAIQDSFKNNYRFSLSTYFRDYSLEYGSITKLVGFEGYLLVVFEHAIGIAVINERVIAGNGDGGPVFINTNNVLPEELTIISDTYGSQWTESVVKSEAGYVYGVDTVAKKIWRVQSNQIEILSDFKVNKFLVDNISLGERELNPLIGVKNVKTHYNNNKKDIMFTFYDDIYKDEEKVWNLCYNELMNEFITFYSWVPSYSENIDTQFFTFNRNTSKDLTLLSLSNYNVDKNSGVLIDSPIFGENKVGDDIDNKATLYYLKPQINSITITKDDYIDRTSYEFNDVKFDFEKDHWLNYKHFEIDGNTLKLIEAFTEEELQARGNVILLEIIPKITDTTVVSDLEKSTLFKTETVALTFKSCLNKLTTDFYLHGLSGIIDLKDPVFPCYWYGEYHPFEFEFVVNDKLGLLKIFTDLIIISNKAEPESFHFEVEGDNYEFSLDKRTMYFRLEKTKLLYLDHGSDIIYNRQYRDVVNPGYTHELYYKKDGINSDRVYPTEDSGLVQQYKSTIFPLYYEKIDTYNDIYYKYHQMKGGDSYDFKNLSGSEVIWNRDLNQFNIVTHIKNSPIDYYGRLRGNTRYKEGKWHVQIPSIIFNLKNEESWTSKETIGGLKIPVPPVAINSQYVPKDITNENISMDTLPNIYKGFMDNIDKDDTTKIDLSDYIKVSNWTYRKETKIRDKWLKIRVRYSGKNLAVIHSLITLYNISYS